MNLEIQTEKLIGIRRHLHAHPELSFQESKTALFIEAELTAAGYTTTRCADTGVVAVLEGAHPGPTLLFRADIDALPIHETNHVAYRSTEPGVMHACGHDVHTTIGLGIALALAGQKDLLHGRIKFVFQPAEEASPVDAPIGAERMVVEGVLTNPDVDAAFAFHVMPTLEVGKIGYTGGPVWARSDLVEIEIEGMKTHAAYPHEGVDAVVVAAHVVTALQTVTSRRVDARDACVLSIGKLEAGNSYNIIADRAKLTGILRTLSDNAADLAMAEIHKIVQGICAALSASGSVTITPGARLTANDVALERRVVDALTEELGAEGIVPHLPQMGAEDFASFSRRVPACYLFLGVRNEDRGITHMLHTPNFDVDEACIPLAVKAMAKALLKVGRTWEKT
ncbi:MAG: M20 family metallopeptidase [bacterium]